MRLYGDFLAILVNSFTNFADIMMAESVLGHPLLYVLLGVGLSLYLGYTIATWVFNLAT